MCVYLFIDGALPLSVIVAELAKYRLGFVQCVCVCDDCNCFGDSHFSASESTVTVWGKLTERIQRAQKLGKSNGIEESIR